MKISVLVLVIGVVMAIGGEIWLLELLPDDLIVTVPLGLFAGGVSLVTAAFSVLAKKQRADKEIPGKGEIYRHR